MGNDLIAALITSVVLIAIVAFIVVQYRRSEEGKKQATNFLNGLKEVIRNKFVDIIVNFDYSKYDNLVGIELDVIDKLTEEAKKYIEAEVIKNGDVLSALALKALDYDNINTFINHIINSIDINEKIEEQLGDRYAELQKKVTEEDKELENTYNNNDLYNIDEENIDALPEVEFKELLESDENGIDKRGFILPNKKEEAEIIPQVDEEEVYDPTDNSMEIIPDDTYLDSKGRLHDKKSGKFIKRE